MTAKEIYKKLSLKCVTGQAGLENIVSSVYIGDLLSWVMSRADAGSVWITIQGHMNIIAVASLSGISCIVLAEGSSVEEDTIKKAVEESIPIFLSEKTSYELSKELAGLGL